MESNLTISGSSLVVLMVKSLPANARRLGFDPWVGKIPWRGNGNPLQYSCLENSMDRGALRATVHGVTKSRTWLSNTHTSKSQIHILSSDQKFYFWKCLIINLHTNKVIYSSSIFFNRRVEIVQMPLREHLLNKSWQLYSGMLCIGRDEW